MISCSKFGMPLPTTSICWFLLDVSLRRSLFNQEQYSLARELSGRNGSGA